jgi:hypothetical protein
VKEMGRGKREERGAAREVRGKGKKREEYQD